MCYEAVTSAGNDILSTAAPNTSSTASLNVVSMSEPRPDDGFLSQPIGELSQSIRHLNVKVDLIARGGDISSPITIIPQQRVVLEQLPRISPELRSLEVQLYNKRQVYKSTSYYNGFIILPNGIIARWVLGTGRELLQDIAFER